MDQTRVSEIYEELNSMIVELDPDPASKGPGYLQELISRTRGYLNRTSVLTQEAHQQHHWLDRDLNAKMTAYQLRSDELLADDRRVTALPSIDDRKAMISLILRDERQEISALEQAVREVSYVEKAIKHRHKELDNTVSSIRMQKSLIDSETRTGSFYGDETPGSRGNIYSAKKAALEDDLGGDEIERLLAESLATPEAPKTGAPGESKPCALDADTPQAVGGSVEVPSNDRPGEETEFDKFLNDDNLDDIFASLDV